MNMHAPVKKTAPPLDAAERELLQQIRVDQAVRALSALSEILRQSRCGLTPVQEHDLWREFTRIGLVKEAA